MTNPSLFQACRVSGVKADAETAEASQKSQRELPQAISRFRRACWKIGWKKLLFRMDLKQEPELAISSIHGGSILEDINKVATSTFSG